MTTRTRSSRAMPGLVVGLLLGFSPSVWSSQSTAAVMNGEQVKQLIVGNTVRGAALATLYRIYYAADGQLSAVFNSGELLAEGDSGTWKIKNGDTVCHEFSYLFGGVERCYQWHKAQGGRYVMRNVDAFKVDDLPVWNIIQGNPLGF